MTEQHHVTKNENGSYTISKGIVHILVGVCTTVALGTAVSISAWWFGFAAWQADMNKTAILVEKHDDWFRSGRPSPQASEKFGALEQQMALMNDAHKKLYDRINSIEEELRKHGR